MIAWTQLRVIILMPGVVARPFFGDIEDGPKALHIGNRGNRRQGGSGRLGPCDYGKILPQHLRADPKR